MVSRYLDWHYWISSNPTALSSKVTMIILVFFALLVLAEIILRIYLSKFSSKIDKPMRKLFFKCESFLLWSSITGFFWLLFAYEGIPVLSAKYFMIIWFIIFAVWAFNISVYATKKMPLWRKAIKDKSNFDKYLVR